MKLRARKIGWVSVLTLLFSCFAVQFPQAVSQASQTMTNYGSIVVFDPDIFWEFGAESGMVKPPWDVAGPLGSGTKEVSSVEVDNTHVRTGVQAAKFYMPAPPRSDAQGRIDCREDMEEGNGEFYMSWWVYFDSSMEDSGGTGGSYASCLGGIQSYFGPSSNKWQYWTEYRFYWDDQSPRRLYLKYHVPFGGNLYGGYQIKLNSTYLNTWLHFQIYIKWSNTTNGIYRAWANKEGQTPILINERTGIKNDPRGYTQWTGDYAFARPNGRPFIVIQLYQGKTGYAGATWYWFDDLVVSTTQVSETYGVEGV